MYAPNQLHICLKDQRGQNNKKQLLGATIIFKPVENQFEIVSEITKRVTENQVVRFKIMYISQFYVFKLKYIFI